MLSSFKGVNALYLNNIAITIGGIATILSGLSLSVAYQYTYAAIFGVAIGMFATFTVFIVASYETLRHYVKIG